MSAMLKLVPHDNQWPEEMSAYVQKYVDLSIQYGRPVSAEQVKNLRISFSKSTIFNGTAPAVCALYKYPASHVIIYKDYWDSSMPAMRENILFHQLGHCLSFMENRGIIDFFSRQPTSIMCYPLINPIYYEGHRQSYYIELFTGVWRA